MQWILDLRSSRMKNSFNIALAGRVSWHDSDSLEYKAVKLNMVEVRDRVGTLCQDPRRVLLEDPMFEADAKDAPAVPRMDLYDDTSNDDVG